MCVCVSVSVCLCVCMSVCNYVRNVIMLSYMHMQIEVHVGYVGHVGHVGHVGM